MQRHVSGDLALLGINVPSPMMMRFWQMLAHPLPGASWEGFALEQVLRLAKPDQAYFWATHQGADQHAHRPGGHGGILRDGAHGLRGRGQHLVSRRDDLGVQFVAALRLDQLGDLTHGIDGTVLQIALAQPAKTVFARQALVRYSYPLSKTTTLHLSAITQTSSLAYH